MLYFILFEHVSYKSSFFKYLIPNLKNSSGLDKTQGLWGNKLKEFEKKLQLLGFKTQLIGSANYTRYHKRVYGNAFKIKSLPQKPYV